MGDRRVAVLLGQGFEDSEFRIPHDRLVESAQVDVIGARAGEELSGYRGREKVRTDRAIDEVRPDDYDLLLIPGGQSPDHLRADDRFVRFVRDFDATGRPIAAVCHGPQLLITAGLVRGRRLTAWRTIQEDLRQIGAQVLDQPLVHDRNWITSRQPSDLEVFSDAAVTALGQPAPAEGTEEARRRERAPTADDRPGVSAAGRGESDRS
jgi:protease I